MANTKNSQAHGSAFRVAVLPLALIASLTLSACTESEDSSEFNGTITLTVENPDRCDPLDQRHCLLPFPSDTFTVADDSTPTGLRVSFALASMPLNATNVRVDPTEWNRNDGFSPGAQIATFVAGIDLAQSRIPAVTDIGASLAADAGVVILDADSGERIPYWAELDATASDDDNRVVLIRPAVNLHDGHRHVVALRNLETASGAAIAAGDVFRAYRDKLQSNVPEVEARRSRYEQVFADLASAGVNRDELFLAWDFTVASTRNLTERLVHMRDDALARLGSAAPAFTVDLVEDHPNNELLRRVSGTFQVPLYMTGGGVAGERLHYGSDGLPETTGSYTASFMCNIPNAVASDDTVVPARASVYGHGLLGEESEVGAGNVRRMSNEHNFVFCATRWIGLSFEDVPNAISILNDLSRFPTLADRLQQGVVNILFLARLMVHADGLVSDPAFQVDGVPVIDRSDVFYDGNSQGGIMGGIATAVSTEWTRAVLGVTAMNYSILLQRSVDWATYRLVYDPAYPDEIDRQLGLILIQMLWDRGEANGYANHLTHDPLPNTPAHTVLMHVAFGDWQVAQDAANIEARTIGAQIHAPAVAPGRLPGFVEPYWGIEPIASYPHDGSAIVIWDSGSPAPPTVNLAPSAGRDPHGDPRNDTDARTQKSEFLRTDGAVVDVCAGAPCMADGG